MLNLSKHRITPFIGVLTAVLVFAAGLQTLHRQSAAVPPAIQEDAAQDEAAPGVAVKSGPASEGLEAGRLRTHIVAAGETLSAIADKYQLDVETVAGANPGAEEIIRPGDELVILPNKGVLHTVVPGDSLWRIASLYQVEVDTVAAANNKADAFLDVGEKLFIPGARPRRGDAGVSRSATGLFMWPAAGDISSLFGYRWGRLHAGIDIANNLGTPIRAAKAGRVIFSGWKGNYGQSIEIEHGQGIVTLYGHLSGYAVSAGQYVQSGQPIGYMGNTGYSTGPHLHFEVRINGVPVDPYNFLP